MLLFCRALFLVVIYNNHFTKPALDYSIEPSADAMEQVRYDYSMKNIPIPSEQEFIIELISSVEKFIKNLKWRSHHYLNPAQQTANKKTFGFNSTCPPPKVDELDNLQNMLYDLIINIKFRKHSSQFQNKLKDDIKEIVKEKRMFIPADKTTNFYKVTKEKHTELLEKSINKEYKKADGNVVKDINKVDKKIATELDLEDRIYSTSERQCFVTLKDHKTNFQNSPSCRLLNPTKTEIGRISKQILEKIVATVREKTKFNQWKNTASVIDWFKNIVNKKRFSFIVFDICDFYPSISEELLNAALDFAKDFIEISDEDRKIIIQARKSLLISKETQWIKKGNSIFDVGQGSFDGAEIAEIVGLFLLSKLQHLNLDLGLYRDDGLGICSQRPRQVEKIKQEMCRIFQTFNLKITIDVNHKVVNFLDITLDLDSELYKPYMKPNNTPIYVNKHSNHPPSIIQNLPAGINMRLSNNSANEEVFTNALPPYRDALKKSGYDFDFKYEPATQNGNRKRTEAAKSCGSTHHIQSMFQLILGPNF